MIEVLGWIFLVVLLAGAAIALILWFLARNLKRKRCSGCRKGPTRWPGLSKPIILVSSWD